MPSKIFTFAVKIFGKLLNEYFRASSSLMSIIKSPIFLPKERFYVIFPLKSPFFFAKNLQTDYFEYKNSFKTFKTQLKSSKMFK